MHAAGAEADPRWQIVPGSEASLLAVASRHWHGSIVSHDELGLRFARRHSFGRRTLLNSNGTCWRERNWNEEPDRGGLVVNLGFGVRCQATPVPGPERIRIRGAATVQTQQHAGPGPTG